MKAVRKVASGLMHRRVRGRGVVGLCSRPGPRLHLPGVTMGSATKEARSHTESQISTSTGTFLLQL